MIYYLFENIFHYRLIIDDLSKNIVNKHNAQKKIILKIIKFN